ncbi:TIGR02253 family HAD-type hydrolase [Candidatus Bathyarchaeota archaeon]|nr:TIGR02253 family HAD-type hydrolase [Candidatus Bathyarchaeota archaeon]
MRVRCLLFDIDDTLYDSTLQMGMARLNAIRAMREAGLPVDLETGLRALEGIVEEFGPHYNRHLERLGLRWSPKIIAAGVIAYRETSAAYLKPYPDTFPVLLRLRESGYLLGSISEGRSVKQWQKLIQLGIHHLFHSVVVSEEVNSETVTPELFERILKELGASPGEAIFIGNQLDTDISAANRLGILSVRIRKGRFRNDEPINEMMIPKFEIGELSEIFDVLKMVN